jgi:membrane associated rhomboid family serine protease
MTPPALAAISARSERQAMDWSLVLISQGIETWIEPHPEAGRWRLIVNEPDYSRAVDALLHYQAENRTPRWQHKLPGLQLVFDLRSIGCLLFLALLFILEEMGNRDLRMAGVMDNHLVHSGQWWRLFTAVTLHADVAHLAANLATGFLMLGLVMGTYGYGVGLLVSYLSGVGGFVGGLLFLPESHRSLGASGWILGALGLLGAQWIALWRHGMTGKEVAARGVLSGCLLLVLLGLSPRENTDVLAHVAGFISGMLLGAVMAFLPQKLLQRPAINGVSLALLVALIVGTWWMALRH